LVESTRPDHRALATEIVEKCAPIAAQKRTFRLGISGAPGVGKSTFIEHFGCFLLENEQKSLAVLKIDPSSSITRGSILGDKTRMEKLATHPRAFIRPSPAGDALGGVARRTRETITLLETAGFDTIFIETVGVGQSETAVKSMTDCFLLLLLPGAGDDLQGIKRGIVEMADLVAVNKSDGDRVSLAHEARVFYQNALHLFPNNASNWTPQVLNCSAIEKIGFSEIQKNLEDFQKMTRENGFFEKNRQNQAQFWLREAIENGLRDTFFNHPTVKNQFAELEKMVAAGQISPFRAAERLLDIFLKK
jgi:LAO/AO transport system kinase